MKTTLLILWLLISSLASFAQVPHPGKPVFMVNCELKGSNGNGSWKYNTVQKFSLSNWNEPLRGKGYTPEERKLPLDLEPGAILQLKVGDKIKFYPCEVDESGSGKEGSYTRVLTSDGVETVTETTQDGTKTTVTTDADFRKEHNVPYNENFRQNARYYQLDELAELERTSDGAILYAYTSIGDNLADWSVTEEVENQVYPEVETFKLTENDLKNWLQFTRTNVKSGSAEDMSLTVKLQVSMTIEEAKKPEITLYGCTELAVAEQSDVMASGKPEGGKFRFWVEPGNLFNVQSDGESSANITGATPGKGTLYVEYTSPEGKINQTSQPASCVKIENYNGGQDVPQIALFDIDGNKLSGVHKIPVSAQPSNIEELVDYVAADQSVLSVVGLTGAVELTGSHKGKTSFQAKTNCGNSTGPIVEVEIVNCDKETVEALEKMREGGMENLKEANERLQKVANSEEFEKARDEIVESTIELLAKSALTIIGSGETHGVIETATEVAEAGESVSEMMASATKEEFDERTLTATLKALGTSATKALLGIRGVHEAAKKFADNLGQIISHETMLKGAMEDFETAYKALGDIIRRQDVCKGEKTEPQKQDVQKTEPTPNPTEPTTKAETPPGKEPTTSTQTPPVEEPATKEPTTDEPTTEEPPVSPPPPTSPPKQVGLPYSPASECGCNISQGIGVSGVGFAALQTGLENLGKCVDNFTSGPLTDYTQTLKAWTAVTDSLVEAIKSGSAGFQLAAKKAVPRINELIGSTKSYDEAGKLFSKEFDACPNSVKTGMEVISSAKTISIDSIKTKY